MDAAATEGRSGAISACVCNYNGEEHLRPCLDALHALDRPPDEILVVDNASTDQSLAILAEEYSDVRVIALAENAGPCPARNLALAEAASPRVLLLDNDAVLAPDALGRLERALGEHPEAVLAQPRSVFADDPERVHYDGAALHYAGLFALRNFYRPLAEAEGQGVVPVGGVVSVALLADREALIASGGFDESYFILFEDLDLSMRLRLAGRTLLSVEDAICLHRGGTAGISFRSGSDYPDQRAFLHSRNRWHFLLKNLSWRTLCLGAPGVALYELVWLLFTLRSGTAGAWLRGKIAFARGISGTLKLRRAVQRTRRVPDRDLLVGGPLTIAPHLQQAAWARRVLAALSGILEGWWRLVRPFCG